MIDKAAITSGKLKKGVYKSVPCRPELRPSVSRFQKSFQASHSGQPTVSPHNTKFKKLPF